MTVYEHNPEGRIKKKQNPQWLQGATASELAEIADIEDQLRELRARRRALWNRLDCRTRARNRATAS